MWTLSGPTEEAIALLEAGGGPLSSGERVVLLSAWAFWNGTQNATLADVVYRLDGRNLRAIATLMLALDRGAAAIDEWILALENSQQPHQVPLHRSFPSAQLSLPFPPWPRPL